MNKKTWIIIATAIAALFFWAFADRPVFLYAQANPVTTVQRGSADEPYPDDPFGCIEVVGPFRVTYNWVIVNRVNFDADGKVHLGFHLNLANLKILGLTTGTIYTGQDHANEVFNGGVDVYGDNVPPWEYSFREVWKNQGHGSAPNWIFTSTIHTTINANGEATTTIDRLSYTCI